MTPAKADIRAWIEVPGRGRTWLATICGVAPKTVSNWLTSEGHVIPAKALRIIETLMRQEKEAAATSEPPASQIVIRLTLDEFDEWNRAALRDGKILSDWIIDTIRAAYQADQQTSAPAAHQDAQAPGERASA